MKYADLLIEIITTAVPKIKQIPTELFKYKPRPEKWSKQELLGHLIDSAYNNHQRFLRAEQQGNLIFQGYDQDQWVIKNDYQARTPEEVISLWKSTNIHLAYLIRNLPKELLEQQTNEHNFHQIGMSPVQANDRSSLGHLIRDYIYHIEYHLNQILDDYEWKSAYF